MSLQFTKNLRAIPIAESGTSLDDDELEGIRVTVGICV